MICFNEAPAFCGGEFAGRLLLAKQDASFNEAPAFCGGEWLASGRQQTVLYQLQ